jgi:hypothetical protein
MIFENLTMLKVISKNLHIEVLGHRDGLEEKSSELQLC